MKLLIIAAGEGSRLRQEGFLTPKPLLQISGKTLIERLIDLAIANKCTEVCIIINNLYPELKTFITAKSFRIPLHLVGKTTPSSLHSFYELRHFAKDEPFILTTVDPVYKPEALTAYINFINIHPEADGIMAVTNYVDDEKPLWVLTDNTMKIKAYQSEKGDALFVSAGFYYFKPSVLPLLEEAMASNMYKMRAFQQFLIDNNKLLLAYDMGKVIDIDHVRDIKAAESLLKK